jgi:putative lipoic acid-binding regulatory protein
MEKKEDFYDKLKIKLEETTTFPTRYMFKFIVVTDKDKIVTIENIFNHLGAVINTKKSTNGKYTSITVFVVMKSVDQIIKKYVEVDAVEGVISL